MAHVVHHKHVQRRVIALRYIRRRPFFFGLPGDKPAATEPPVSLLEQLQVYQRALDRSRWRGYGKKAYKRVYHRRRRSEARRLEHAVLREREDLFERLAPDGWRGRLGWDIW